MYRLVKMFDKTAIAQGETVTKFWFDSEKKLFGVETDKAFYNLEKIENA